jgi:hypothetical protein
MDEQRRETAAPATDSESAEHTHAAIRGLRIELLRAASNYGAVAALSSRDKQQIRAWSDWLEWVLDAEQRVMAIAAEFDLQWSGV